MKKLLTFAAVASLALPGGAAFAAHPYVGVQSGIVRVNNGDSAKAYIDTFKTHYTDIQNYGSRLFVGVNVNSVLSVEGGFTALPDSVYYGEGIKDVRVKLKGHIFDVVAKGGFPVTPKVRLYGLAGLALVHNHLQVSNKTDSASKGVRELHYKLGVGAEYAITSSLSVGVEYTCTPGQVIDVSPAMFNIGDAAAKRLGTTPDVDTLMLTLKYTL